MERLDPSVLQADTASLSGCVEEGTRIGTGDLAGGECHTGDLSRAFERQRDAAGEGPVEGQGMHEGGGAGFHVEWSRPLSMGQRSSGDWPKTVSFRFVGGGGLQVPCMAFGGCVAPPPPPCSLGRTQWGPVVPNSWGPVHRVCRSKDDSGSASGASC